MKLDFQNFVLFLMSNKHLARGLTGLQLRMEQIVLTYKLRMEQIVLTYNLRYFEIN